MYPCAEDSNSKREKLMPSSKTIASIARGADILKILSSGIDRISDISERLQLSKGTAHRFLKSLESSGLVIQDPITRRYYLGPLVLELASRPLIIHQNLTICAFEDMRYLRDLSHETVILHIRIGLERICLEELQSPENIKYAAGKGFVAPLYTGSAGKILLSELQDEELQLLIRSFRFKPVGPNTITNKEALLDELRKVRSQGYATSFGERVPGSASISVPIRGYVCPVAMSVLGPDNRFTLDKMMDVLGGMKERAARITRKLQKSNQLKANR
jgi:IclR family KDG regulon transcriptional repressor